MDKIKIPSFQIDATLIGVNEALNTANELVDTLKKANTLVERLAQLDIEVVIGDVANEKPEDEQSLI